MKKFCLSLVLLFSNQMSFAIADWTMYIYMQADNDLSSYAQLDLIEEMAKADMNFRKVKVYVECDIPNHIGTKRYKIKNGEAVLVETLTGEMGRNPKAELIRGFRWAVHSGPAEHYAISLWGHGTGIIDPVRSMTRGILFDYTNDTYLNNQQLAEALAEIKTEVLGGKNIDVVGMDSCLMGDLEIAYQIKDSVDYFVGSQQTEPAKGWDYAPFLTQASASTLTPSQFAISIVNSYGSFYSLEGTNNYTQSAVDLSKVNLINQNLNQFVSKWNECENILGYGLKEIINNVRENSLEFDDPDFIDLYNFYQDVLDNVNKIVIPDTIQEPEIDETIVQPPRPIFSRPNYHGRPNVFSRPSLLLRPSFSRPNLNSRPSNPRLTGFSRPTNLNYSRPSFFRPPRLVVSMKSINFELLDLSNNELISVSKKLQELKDLLYDGMGLIEMAVVANTCGSDVASAKGMSIYFPKNSIHDSYALTNFAIDGNWISFLNKFV